MAERLRGRKAQKQRARRLFLYPMCAPCTAEGKATATFEIDHIVPLHKGGADTDDNCQGICEPHHRVKTRLERGGGYGYDESGRPLDPSHPWNET